MHYLTTNAATNTAIVTSNENAPAAVTSTKAESAKWGSWGLRSMVGSCLAGVRGLLRYKIERRKSIAEAC